MIRLTRNGPLRKAMSLALIMKALGVKIPPETLAQVERIIPQIPARANQAIQLINAAVQQADQRARALEARMQILEDKIDALVNLLVRDAVRRSAGNSGRIADAGGSDRGLSAPGAD